MTRAADLLTEQTGSGGLERAVSELAAAQVGIGLAADVFSIKLDTLSRIGESALQNRWADVAGAISNGVKGSNPDVLHAHDWYAAPVAEYFYTKGFRSIVSTSHLPIRRGFTYRDTALSWQAKNWLESRLFDIAKKVIAPSALVANFLAREYGVPHGMTAVIPHGVDSRVFQHSDHGLRSLTKPHLLAVGRVTEQKGIELLIRALPRIRKHICNLGLSIIGEGDRLDACRRLAGQLCPPGTVTFGRFTNADRLVQAYAAANLFVMPSLFEPFGLVGLEALACGCPVLAIAPTGASYLEEHELTPHHSPERLAEAILERLNAQYSSGIPSQSLRERALKWPWKNAALKTADLYQEVLK